MLDRFRGQRPDVAGAEAILVAIRGPMVSEDSRSSMN